MVNSVTLIGRLGKDPVTAYTKNGAMVVKFTLATSKKYKTDNETKEVVTWHNIKAYGKLAELCEKYIAKGSQVYIDGSINNSSFDDRDTGQKRFYSEVVASAVLFLDRKKTEGNDSGVEQIQPAGKEDDIPF